MVNTLFLLMNGHLVGTLTKDQSGRIRLDYDDAWTNSPIGRSISLSLPMTKKTHVGDVVYNYFDNLLPDNSEIRRRIRTKFRIETNHPFDMLSAIGKDSVGALQMVKDISSYSANHTLTYRELPHQEIAHILKSYQSNPLGMQKVDEDFRISLAGAQEKTALLFHEGKWCLPLGNTATTHILKLPIGHIGQNNIDLSLSCENEWLSGKIATAFGFPCAHSDIIQLDDVKVLSVERFDRMKVENGLYRIPQEDMCQALGISSGAKYESDGGPSIQQVMGLLKQSSNPEQDRETFFTAQMLFWLLAAPDGHGKNFSLFIKPNNTIALTPLYDILSARPMLARKQIQRQKLKMAMALTGERKHYLHDKILPRHFYATAEGVGITRPIAEQWFNDLISKIPDVIAQVEQSLPKDFPPSVSEPILEGLMSARQETMMIRQLPKEDVLLTAENLLMAETITIAEILHTNESLTKEISRLYHDGLTGKRWQKACALSNQLLSKLIARQPSSKPIQQAL